MSQKSPASLYGNFTNKYSVSKTLRFELKPTEQTALLLEQTGVLNADKHVRSSYVQIKTFFDQMHRLFIAEVLGSDSVRNAPITDIKNAYLLVKGSSKENRKSAEGAYKKSKSEYIGKLRGCCDAAASSWEKKYGKVAATVEDEDLDISNDKSAKKSKGVEFICSAKAFSVLQGLFPEQSSLFDEFKGFTTYLGSFQETRKNLYAIKGEATSVFTRVITNLERYFANEKAIGDRLSAVHAADMSLLTKLTSVPPQDTFTQEGIEHYNVCIGEVNKKTKELRDSTKGERSAYPLLRRLDKQILAEVVPFVELVETHKGLVAQFEWYRKVTQEKYLRLDDLMQGLGKGVYDIAGVFMREKDILSFVYRHFAVSKKIVVDLARRLDPKSKVTEFGEERISLKESFVSLHDLEASLAAVGVDLGRSFVDLLKNDVRLVLEKKGVVPTSGVQFIVELWNEKFAEFKAVPTVSVGSVLTDESRRRIKVYADRCLALHRFVSQFALDSKTPEDIPDSFSAEFYEGTGEKNGLGSIYRWGSAQGESGGVVTDDSGAPLAVRFYNAFRNFVTKVPDDEEKVKISFGNGNLLGGFDQNKEKDKSGVMFRKGDRFLLGIIRKGAGDIFNQTKHPEVYSHAEGGVEKMVYKLFPAPQKMIPKVAFAAKNRKTVGWTEEIQSVKDAYAKFQEKKLKDKTGSVAFPQKDLARLISYYQRALEVLTVENETCSYKEVFGLTWKDPEQYTSLADFNADVERNNYKISFVPLSGSYIDTLQARGDLYLFEIVNKDLSLVSDKLRTGSENMHTMYFRALMNPENSHVFKLDGEAEMFYRDAVDKEALGTKTDKEGKELVNSRGEKVIKGYRYSKAKWLLHLKMTLNKSAAGSGRPYEFNSGVIAALRSKDIPNESIRVIGIDRGEKHLAYYTVIDMNGHIYEAGSLNTIQVAGKDVDYHALLHARMKEREDNRRGWDVVREIKNLKKGWVGGAVHTIVALAEKYNAVIVLEDLSFRFKQIRSGVEKSTYQQLEKGLIDKCGYLVNKKSVANEPGGVLNGYQLAAPFESFEKLGKQTGFIFYVNAGYTSKIDPITGFRQTVYISPSDSTEKIREQFMKFDEISYSAKYQSFCFTYNTRQCLVSDKAKRAKNQSDVYEKTWKVHGKVHRVRRVYRDGVSEKHWSPELVVPDDMLHELFGQYGIDVQRSILDQIGDEEDAALQQRLLEKKASTFEPKARNFWERLAFIFNLICQVRNATTAEYLDGKVVGEDVDFIESPVYPFFATGGTVLGKRLHTNWAALDAKVEPGARHLIDKNEYNGDTNGAYNIARKGALLVEEKIRSNAVGVDTKKVNLAISNAEWDKWVDKMSDKTHTE